MSGGWPQKAIRKILHRKVTAGNEPATPGEEDHQQFYPLSYTGPPLFSWKEAPWCHSCAKGCAALLLFGARTTHPNGGKEITAL
jgi:hypothetical protein